MDRMSPFLGPEHTTSWAVKEGQKTYKSVMSQILNMQEKPYKSLKYSEDLNIMVIY